ncbi:5-histidylcysteine sulfoxide synthase [Acinetobacter sp. 194]|uniref:5-histidylcysteine sulfoxide synthase n=1 Tax=Acinetobacter shaoyimingii TaxID=2715164 RepID=UPI00140C5CF6|nr:5-histidylcysteine sulfoxide synthase [Acinetobacter shaoyimingii]NHB56601.1 5-histidylcysteine sulfoxide synthase [Acinetobacter shaoyimingii]
MSSSHALSTSDDYLEKRICSTPLLNIEDESSLRQNLRTYFINTFDTYESLFECLKSEQAYYTKSIPLRHPLIFYFGHTATFFINKLLLSKLITQRINPTFESIFAVGVDEMSWDDLNDEHYEWPSPQQVLAYRQQVRFLVLDIIDHAPLSLPIDWNHPWWAILMGIEHERIHLETSSVLIRQHDLQHVQNHCDWRPNPNSQTAPENEFIHVPKGEIQLNKNFQSPYYGWDNEYGLHQNHVNSFQASKYLVSNEEFKAFVDAGGYDHDPYWEDEGLRWRQFTQAKSPCFWLKKSDEWYLRLMTEEVPMPWDWPVEVNFHEAKAFCHWKSEQTGLNIRLPSEDEWYRLCDYAGLNEEIIHQPANLELKMGASSCPVTTCQHGNFYDVRGNVWQWTETEIYPFEGFQVHPIYDDFTVPTFDGRHNLIKGGSWISCGNEALYSARYAFRRHFFQHAGFRYVASENQLKLTTSQYETDRSLSEYIEFHYGSEYFNVPNFSKALVDLALNYVKDLKDRPTSKALDLGCAVGRASFELAKHFNEVVGIDFSARFIQHGVELAQGNTLHYTLTTEGQLTEFKSVQLSDLGLDAYAQRVKFFQGDACNLKPQFTSFDFILAANLIDRLHHPAQFLSSIHDRLNMGGILMITSPYTWLEEHTEQAEWIGGFKKDGENFTTLDGLHALLDAHFEQLGEAQSVPFVIRETQRKFQHTLSEVTVWKKKA